ncbi:aminotransferase class I/II-fold pyridoxal phosphate-dependent enzyme [Candidatus Pelagibacter sp.]|nr:aminotransferase class I/II-fold pyridoxal phosphate-dependent enzyme [Candidatus Pelagibacter sp.]
MPGFETIDRKELNQIKKIFKQGGGVLFRNGFDHLRGKSYQVNKFEKKFAKKFKSNYALAVSSGTAALRVALASLGVSKNDEVITQSFTFVATVEAIIESGAKPICTEIDTTLNMCPDDLLSKITKKTKAVILVHMLGSPGNISKIKSICKKKKIYLIEDTAWGIGAKYNKKFLGTIGEIGTFSFDFAKTMTTGEGGMLLFKNKKHFLKAKAWHDHGHENNPKVPRWEDTRSSSGFNFRMTELQGAVGISQLDKFNQIFNMHKKNKNIIINKLRKFKNIEFRKLPKNSIDAPESLIFSFKNKNLALKFRQNLSKKNYSTKILPEAIAWHFAGKWTHMEELDLKKNKYFKKSENYLAKFVSVQIFYNMKKDYPEAIEKSVKETL